MEIKVLGAGCTKCKTLERLTSEAIAQTGIEATVVKVEDFIEIMKLGVMTTPALVVNGVVLVSGRVPTVAEISQMLINAIESASN